MTYTRITPSEREIIATQLAQHKGSTEIARILGCDKRAISREINSNR